MTKKQTLVELFVEQVERTPYHLALKFRETGLSYKQLDELSDQLAQHLVKNGVKPGTLVPVCLGNPMNMVIAIWGILKAGAAYVPIDTEFPVDRIRYMLADTNAMLVITDSSCKSFLSAIDNEQVILTDNNWASIQNEAKSPVHVHIDGEDIAYVIYTSGSTGNPKGVLIQHKSVIDYLDGLYMCFPYADCKSFALGVSFSADSVITHLFGALTHGSELHVFSKYDYNDAAYIHGYFEEHGIECLKVVPSHWKSLSLNGKPLLPKKILMFGGEALNTEIVKDIIPEGNRECILINHYGPTEATVGQLVHEISDNNSYGATIPIGKTFTDAVVYILDEAGNEVTGDNIGELYISGTCLAKGYLNRPELTEQRFVTKDLGKGEIRLYKTGDLVRRLADGDIEFLGRIDDQVKIHGYRIELGEIENTLQNAPGVKQCVVLAKEGPGGEKRLIGYIVCLGQYDKQAILGYLAEKLPYYMVPQLLVHLPELPFLPNGKVNRSKLPNPDAATLLANPYMAPVSVTEQLLSSLWKEILSVDRAGADDNFFELGGTSLLAIKLVGLLKSRHLLSLPIVKLYQFPKLKDLAFFLDGKTVSKNEAHNNKSADADVAIIGMSGRFPGADSIEELWTLLKEGRETVKFFSDDELDSSVSTSLKNNSDYVKARGVLNDVKGFDAAFFGINPKMAELMDPQQRIFLEIAWEALEQSGYVPAKYDGSIGVFAGVRFNTYYPNNVLSHPDLIEKAGDFQIITLNDKDYVAGRTAYNLNLKGPAVNVQSACSTSLVAVAQAVQSIRNGQCKMALAGGASVNAPTNIGHLYEEGAILSNDGHCRPFDADAKGTLFSDGAGVVLLKSKEDALRDGDTIYAVIKGIGLSNDGGAKGSFTAPSAEGQAAAISMAINDAGVSPADITYIEAHGTATPLGDPIEIEGLKMAFGKQAVNQYCAIGSVKSNFGHLTTASGVTGLIKACLSLYHKQILPSVNYNKPNPYIDFENSPFYVNNKLQNWHSDKERYAGVSSFGIGGTNAHLILAEGSNIDKISSTSRPAQLMCWSAKSKKSLDLYGEKLAKYLGRENVSLADAAYTLRTSREEFNHRRFIVATDTSDFLSQSASPALFTANTKSLDKKAQQVVFMFPGQGDQYVNMGKSLYESEKVFRAAMDECAAILQGELGENILDVIYPKEVTPAAIDKLRHTRYSQPSLFAIGYSLGKLWNRWGITPSAFVGHSIGEFVAAYFAGIFSLEDGLKIIAARGRMMDELPGGSMLSVRLHCEKVREYLSDKIALAAINSPQLCVVAGADEDINALSEVLNSQGILNKVLPTSHAFHSHMMDDAIGPFLELLKNVKFSQPNLPIASSVTGNWLKPEEAISPAYWAKHMRATVVFGDAVQQLMDGGYSTFLELGPGKSAATLARQQAGSHPIIAISSFEKEEPQLRSDNAILKALGNLWLNGIEPNWNSFYKDENRVRLRTLPTYAFDKKDYWVEARPRDYVAKQQLVVGTELSRTETTETEVAIPRKQQFIAQIKDVLENAFGMELPNAKPGMSFIEIGFDSLLLTQVSLLFKKQFSVPVTFRQLNEELCTIELLADYLDKNLPEDAKEEKTELKPDAADAVLTQEEEADIKKPFGAIARIERKSASLDEKQQQYLSELIERYNAKTKGSKEYTQKYRAQMADPRVVSGFKPATKELAYAIVTNKSKGSRLWDIDGNEYIDALNGFGSNMLGHQPDFLKQALIEQVEKGYEIGPQHELAGEVSQLVCEMTGFDRTALCNTGSEAVIGAMRIARTVTGRSLIVSFNGSYHGITDEVISRGSKKHKTYPAAPGILPEAVQNMLVLEYGTEETLRIIEERSHEIAAVLVEPIQSRRCDFQPVAFLKKLRHITKKAKTVLVFDEVISGFRFHPGGVQAMFGIKADVATYGKVVGGGLPIGIIAGEKQYMDALDGGWWKYGDESMPEAGVTYFAGTFVRHPLVLATAKATLNFFKATGPALQERLNANGLYVANAVNEICRRLNVPIAVAQFGSLWRLKFLEEYAYLELFFVLMRLKGIHIIEGFPCFITAAHTEADLETIINCVEESLIELKQVRLIPYYKHASQNKAKSLNIPSAPFAKLGKDKDGNPAWFVMDENNPGKYLQVVN
jgi:amino acid adenylation domain-containing protein